MIEAYTHHALTPMKQAFDDSRWLRQTRDKRSIGIRKPSLYPAELREHEDILAQGDCFGKSTCGYSKSNQPLVQPRGSYEGYWPPAPIWASTVKRRKG